MIKITYITASTKNSAVATVLNSRSVSVVKVDEVSSSVEVGVTVLEDDDCFC